MRVLSLTFREAMFAQESGEVVAWLLTITHPNLDPPIRLTSDPTELLSTDPLRYVTTSRGHEFQFVGMALLLPDENEKSSPAAKMVIGNVDRGIVPLVRSINSPAQVLMEGLLVSDLGTVEVSVPQLDIVHVGYDAGQLNFDLSMDAMATESYPAGSFVPSSFPALFT